MKTMISFIFFNLFIFTTTLSLLSATSAVIYDSAGNKLLRGFLYYILPLLRGTGGGLTLSRNTKDACPLYVTQESSEVNNGGPFTFIPIVLQEEIIRGAYPISIEADVANPCHGSNIWKVTTVAAAKDDDDGLLTNYKDKNKNGDDEDKKVVPVQIVTAGGEFNKPESCFQIVEDEIMPGILQSYQIQHCPFKCGSPSTDLTCYNVGIIRDADGKGYLGLTDAIFPVVFKNTLGTFSHNTLRGFPYYIFTTTLSLLSATSAVIYDSAGNKLLRGFPYYILPLLRGTGGGLTLSRNTKDACPLNVTQESFEVNNGGPFTFIPIVLQEEIIRGAYPISIEADVANPCHGSNIWKVTTVAAAKDDDDGLLTNYKDKNKNGDDEDKRVVPVQIVTAGGEFNKPESCFQIVEDEIMPGILQSYQIQHCPFKCGSPSTDLTCYNVGIIRDADGKGYLGLTDAIFPVVFKNTLGTFSQSAKISQLSAKGRPFSQ